MMGQIYLPRSSQLRHITIHAQPYMYIETVVEKQSYPWVVDLCNAR